MFLYITNVQFANLLTVPGLYWLSKYTVKYRIRDFRIHIQIIKN